MSLPINPEILSSQEIDLPQSDNEESSAPSDEENSVDDDIIEFANNPASPMNSETTPMQESSQELNLAVSDKAESSTTPNNDEGTGVYDDIVDFANNPAMDRVQEALRVQLQKTHDRVNEEFLERQQDLKNVKKEREDCGVELYGMQQQLARLQSTLEQTTKDHQDLVKKSAGVENKIPTLQNELTQKKKSLEEEKRKVSKSSTELDNLLVTIRQANNYNKEIQDEVAVTRRAASKVEETVKGLEKEKSSQDVYIDSLNQQIKRLEADVHLSEEQLAQKKQHSSQADMVLKDTLADLEALASEKKQLVQDWNSSVIAVRRRDQALTAAKKALEESSDKVKDHETELSGLKNDIIATQEELELKKFTKNKLENECKFINTEISKKKRNLESMSEHYEILSKTIVNTNEEENKVKRNIKHLEAEKASVSQTIELISKERKMLEEKLATKKYEQNTMNLESTNLVKKEKSILANIHAKEIEIADIQNDLARLKIDTMNTEAHIEQLSEHRGQEEDRLKDIEKKLNGKEVEIRRRNNEIQGKTNKVDRLNRKYTQILEGAEEDEPLGPLEATIKSLKKHNTEEEIEVQKLQDDWVSDQSKLIHIIEETEVRQGKIREVTAMLNVLKHKKLRLIQEINLNEAALKTIEWSTKSLHTDISKLNELIGKNAKLGSDMSNENSVKEKELGNAVEEMKKESLELEKKISDVQTKKTKIIEETLEIEKEILSWEKKIQLEKETQIALNTGEDAHEIKGMEKEIHRMKQILERKKRDQEKMIRQMELAIHKREDIAVKYKNSKLSGSKEMNSAEVKIQTNVLKKQIEEAEKEFTIINAQTMDIDKTIQEARDTIATTDQDLEKAKEENFQLQKEMNLILFEEQRYMARKSRLELMLQKFQASREGKIEILGHQDRLNAEKSLEVSLQKIRRVQNVLSGLRIEYSHYDELFERVNILATDILEENEINRSSSIRVGTRV